MAASPACRRKPRRPEPLGCCLRSVPGSAGCL